MYESEKKLRLVISDISVWSFQAGRGFQDDTAIKPLGKALEKAIKAFADEVIKKDG